MSDRNVRLAALADIHFGKNAAGTLQPLLGQISQSADILVLAGDLTDYGLPEEAHLLAKDLSAAVRIPIVAVLGNHDYESGHQQEVTDILAASGVKMLDGEACEVLGIGFAGVKGFCGGFGQRVLAPWGEPIVKQFVREALDEALKLESALSRLRTQHRFAILHYAPIQDTVEGEPLEILPFLGCSRLEEPLNRYPLTAVFHGHAHHGKYEGKTKSGVPVFNVAHSLMLRRTPERPFHYQELTLTNDFAANA
ncbi:MAG: metallophosphoesterase family protein [Pirellulaceae bacterium]